MESNAMASPFPGMNPYLEQSETWVDFHNTFLTYARAELLPRLGKNYLVKVEARLYLHELSSDERRFFGVADVSFSDAGRREPASQSVATLQAPVQLEMPSIYVERQLSLEIRDVQSRRIVTVVELLSPTNKTPGPDRDDYLRKRLHDIDGRVNFVEIDLRRGGTRPGPPEIPECAYYVFVARELTWGKFDFWPIGLRDRLPIIPIPLAAHDSDVLLDLQDLLDKVYDASGYGDYIYNGTPEPPLSAAADCDWAQHLVPGRTGREAYPT